MIWILLAALGIPLWMVVGALAATLISRRAFKRAPGVFPVKLRIVSGEFATLKDSWPRRPGYARWVHDVLLLQHGLALVQTEALPVAEVTSSSSDGSDGLGDDPLVMILGLDDGSSVELAAPASAGATVSGPFGEIRS